MTKRAMLAWVLFLAVSIAGCGGSGGSTSTAADAPAESAATAGSAPSASAAQSQAAKDAELEQALLAGPPPTLVVETSRGTFEIEMYPKDAPKTVTHIVKLANRNFYNGQRIHRVEPGFVIQFGDPLTRDMRQSQYWGTGGSGSPIGVAEIKRPHRTGAVAMAHAGDPSRADSQMYVALSAERTRQLDGNYTVFGQVTSGMDVVQKIQANDMIKRVSVKASTDTAPKPAP